MPYTLDQNGNIIRQGGALDSQRGLHYLAPSVSIAPGDRNYELLIDMLTDGEVERARSVLAEYRRIHAQAS